MAVGAGNIQFTYAQLEGLWNLAGGNPQYAALAASVAMAESSGNSAAYDNDSDGSIDRGLWQINSVHGAQSTYDVMGNARAAVNISNNGTNWTPWVTYNKGLNQPYYNPNVPPDTSMPINATNAAANQPSSPVGQDQLPGGTTTGTTGTTGTAQTTNFWSDWGGGFGCFVDPLQCNPGSLIDSTAGKIMIQVIALVLNPFIEIAAGALGIIGGGGLMILGLYMMMGQTQAGQRLKQASSSGLTLAGMASAQPELIAAGSAGASRGIGAAGRQRITSIRGQQVGARQEASSQRISERTAYQQQQQTTREDLRARARQYSSQQQSARQTSAAQARSNLSAQQHRQTMARARQRARLRDQRKAKK